MITTDSVVDVSAEPRHELRLENNLVRAYWIALSPGASTQVHHHGHPYAGVCIGDSLIRNEIAGEGTYEMRMREGDVMYTPGDMTHRIENIGDTDFQNLTMEVLGSTGHKTSSLKRLERERRHLQMVVDERALRVAHLALAAGEQCDLIGDHLIIWLRGEVNVSTFSDTRKLRQAGDFVWCCCVAAVASTEGAKVAIVEIA
jgi:quercetin dioxygenase-like cupin family protein